MPTYLIYVVTNRVNGKQYVGHTKFTPEKRWEWHCNDAVCGSKFWLHCSIRKHGPTNFEISVLEERLTTRKEAAAAETKWIQKLNTYVRGLGYNMTPGADCPPDATGKHYPAEIYASRSAAMMGNQ